ncbi:hypothetical protein NPX99_05475 [Bartonella sp. 220]|uniref:hypothetical protein n=1 Tax=Bartonella sp. 220B TaxID=2967260 RepID=UPI0022A9965D|nr:hypothetical protein [Bartonella sp. 220B]MCZ2158723.1 hypothetical protein [Bartonella sp. 220B]
MAVFMKFLGLLGLITIGVLFFMVMIRLPYFFIKYVRLYCKATRELRESTTQQKNAIQHLRGDKKEMKRQNLALDTKIRLLSFKESLFLWPKECKILVFISILIVPLLRALSIRNLQDVLSVKNLELWMNNGNSFIAMLPGNLWICALLFSPIIGILSIKLMDKLRKTIHQLEEAIEQRDKALRMQDAIGGGNDE